jgi:hypothetical protein
LAHPIGGIGSGVCTWIKSGFFIPNSTDFRHFFGDSNLRQALCLIHYTMDYVRWQSGNAKIFRYIIWLLARVNRIDWSEHPCGHYWMAIDVITRVGDSSVGRFFRKVFGFFGIWRIVLFTPRRVASCTLKNLISKTNRTVPAVV